MKGRTPSLPISKPIVLLLFVIDSAANMLSNGDFQVYTAGNQFSTAPWYAENSSYFTISNFYDGIGYWTNSLSLMATPNVSVCQQVSNFTLDVRYNLSLKIQYLSPKNKPTILQIKTILNGVITRNVSFASLEGPTIYSSSIRNNFQATQISNIFCFRLNVQFATPFNPLTEDFVIDNIKIIADHSNQVSVSWQISLSSPDGLAALITTNLMESPGWNLSAYAASLKLIDGGQPLTVNFSVISNQPLHFEVISNTPIGLTPSLSLKLPDYNFKNQKLQWVYYSLSRIFPNNVSNSKESCLEYESSVPNICKIYCQSMCLSCSAVSNNCTSCRYPFSDKKCRPERRMVLLSITRFFLKNFNNPSFKIFTLLLSNLKLYRYMKITYDGCTQQIILTEAALSETFQNLFFEEQIEKYLESFDLLPNIKAYTNPKFLYQERKDAIFYRNSFFFFSVNLILKLLIFLLLSRLFLCLFKWPVSINFRLYSFKAYLLEMLLVEDIQFLTFLGFRNYNTFFGLYARAHAVNVGFCITFFLCLVSYICLPFLYRYCYNNLSSYFFANCYRKKNVLIYYLFRFGLKPTIEAVIHATLYQYPKIQLLLISLFEILNFFVLSYYQILRRIFCLKIFLLLEIFQSLSVAFINICLVIKYLILESNDQSIKSQLQSCLFCLYIGVGLTILLYYLISFIIYVRKTFCKKEDDDENDKLSRTNMPSQRQKSQTQIDVKQQSVEIITSFPKKLQQQGNLTSYKGFNIRRNKLLS